MEGRFRFLGTGSSMGVPIIGCKCSVCTSDNPKNKRTRSGALIQVCGKTILLDAGPDYRTQALAHKIDHIDGFILTHAHYDHMAGLDDLKIYSHLRGKKLPCLALDVTFKDLRSRYNYLFRPTPDDENNSPFFSWKSIQDSFGTEVFQDLSFNYVSFFQTKMQVMGLKIGDLAYISDIKEYDPRLIADLQGTKTLIVSALRQGTSPAHFSIEQACDFSKLVGAQTTYLTHIAHEVGYDEVQKGLPDSVFLSYDNLEVSFQME